MYKYQIILYWSDNDNKYIAEVPELSGCMADGETPVKAIENAQDVIRVWIESAIADGEKVPEPKGTKISA